MLLAQKGNNPIAHQYINKKFSTNVDEIYIDNIIQVLLDQNKIRKKPTSKGNSYFVTEANNITILDETKSMHDNPQGNTLKKKKKKKCTEYRPILQYTAASAKLLHNLIDEIRSQLKTQYL